MKKILTVMLMMILALAMLTACGEESNEQKEEKSGIDLETIRTLGDAFALEGDNDQFASDYSEFVYVFEKDGIAYRVYADLTKDVAKEYEKLDASKQDYTDKVKELVSDMKIKKSENLTEKVISQDDLDKYVGKTGEKMLDEGWTVSAWDTENSEFTLNNDAFCYTVSVDAKLEKSDDFDGEKEFKDLKIKSIKYYGLGDAAKLQSEQ